MTRFPHADRHAAWLTATVLAVAVSPPAAAQLRDAPVAWFADDMRTIARPRARDPNIVRAAVDATLFRPLARLLHPGRFVRRVGTAFGGDHVPAAGSVNTLDEVPSSSWFTNRIGLFPIDPDDAARGPAVGPAPAPPFVVVRPKTQGVTPGFNVRDANGQVWVIKFDIPEYAGMASAAGVISSRILHTAGYHVPDDRILVFARAELEVGADVMIRFEDEQDERPMTDADLDTLLADVAREPDGRWRALASRFLDGTPLGPFDWKGRRRDDPNDRVDHEHRRELRGLAVFAAWLCHYDTKQGNTLDMFVEDAGRRYVRHYLIDFASTLGAGGQGPFPTACFEYSLDVSAMVVRALSLGLYQDPWRRLERPAGLSEIGYFESTLFTPRDFRPLEPNSAFANLTDRDGYWAAKIIAAFTDAHLEAIVARGDYANPEAARWMVRTLAARRDAIVSYWFHRVPPLDFFVAQGDTLRFHDLGVEHGVFPAERSRYRARAAPARPDRGREPATAWSSLESTRIRLPAGWTHAVPDGRAPFLAVDVQVDRGSGWGPTTTVLIAGGSGRVVALER